MHLKQRGFPQKALNETNNNVWMLISIHFQQEPRILKQTDQKLKYASCESKKDVIQSLWLMLKRYVYFLMLSA